MRAYENGFEDQDFTDPNNPSIIEPWRRSLEGYLIVPFVAALLLLVGVLVYGALQDDAPIAPQPDTHTNPLKEAVPPSPEMCALPDDLCQPGTGPAKPVAPMPEPPVPYVEIPPPTSVPLPPDNFLPQVPPEDLVPWPPDVLPA